MAAINFERERGNKDVDKYCISFRENVYMLPNTVYNKSVINATETNRPES